MTAKQQYDSRHSEVLSKIVASRSKIVNGYTLVACKLIGQNLGISQQTVYNYIQGRIKDGYLAEAILRELKSYKP